VLKDLPGVSPRLVEQRGDALMDAIARGQVVPEKELPRFPRGERRAMDPAFDERVEKLKAARNKMAAELKLDPGVLCPKGTLEAIARAKPKTRADVLAIPDIRKWQVEVLGKEFLGVLGT
jgi:ribonuclease D